uniref:Uncharacterized protein n=2 Tax=Arundo donax TaxID=35708 RepID=A0A0A9FQA3_ARUDO
MNPNEVTFLFSGRAADVVSDLNSYEQVSSIPSKQWSHLTKHMLHKMAKFLSDDFATTPPVGRPRAPSRPSRREGPTTCLSPAGAAPQTLATAGSRRRSRGRARPSAATGTRGNQAALRPASSDRLATVPIRLCTPA